MLNIVVDLLASPNLLTFWLPTSFPEADLTAQRPPSISLCVTSPSFPQLLLPIMANRVAKAPGRSSRDRQRLLALLTVKVPKPPCLVPVAGTRSPEGAALWLRILLAARHVSVPVVLAMVPAWPINVGPLLPEFRRHADCLLPVSRNWAEQDRIENEISATEAVLQEALSRLARLRAQKRVLRERSETSFRRGMAALDEEDGVAPVPMSEEQQLVGQVESAGAFGVVDWDSLGLGDPSLLALPGGQGSSCGTPPVSQGSGGS